MDFISNQDSQIKEMLQIIGVDSIDALFAAIPPPLLCQNRLLMTVFPKAKECP